MTPWTNCIRNCRKELSADFTLEVRRQLFFGVNAVIIADMLGYMLQFMNDAVEHLLRRCSLSNYQQSCALDEIRICIPSIWFGNNRDGLFRF